MGDICSNYLCLIRGQTESENSIDLPDTRYSAGIKWKIRFNIPRRMSSIVLAIIGFSASDTGLQFSFKYLFVLSSESWENFYYDLTAIGSRNLSSAGISDSFNILFLKNLHRSWTKKSVDTFNIPRTLTPSNKLSRRNFNPVILKSTCVSVTL